MVTALKKSKHGKGLERDGGATFDSLVREASTGNRHFSRNLSEVRESEARPI